MSEISPVTQDRGNVLIINISNILFPPPEVKFIFINSSDHSLYNIARQSHIGNKGMFADIVKSVYRPCLFACDTCQPVSLESSREVGAECLTRIEDVIGK